MTGLVTGAFSLGGTGTLLVSVTGSMGMGLIDKPGYLRSVAAAASRRSVDCPIFNTGSPASCTAGPLCEGVYKRVLAGRPEKEECSYATIASSE